MSGDDGWSEPLHRAGRLAVAAGDVHHAVSAYDTVFFAELLSGDPRRCAPIAARLGPLGAEARRRRIVWLNRRVTAQLRELGATTARPRPLGASASRQVLDRVARGQPSVAIGRSLRISPATVDSHVRAEMKRTGARTRLQGAALCATTTSFVAPLRLCPSAVSGLTLSSADNDHDGARVDLAALPPVPWTLGRTVVVTGTACTPDDRASLVLAVARGASVEVALPRGDHTELVDALRRLGAEVETVDVPAVAESLDHDLGPLDRQMVDRLAAGATVTGVAAELIWSRRTIERRLTRLRETHHTASTDEVVLKLAGRARAPDSVRRVTAGAADRAPAPSGPSSGDGRA